MRFPPLVHRLTVATALSMLSLNAYADDVKFGPNDVQTVFAIGKSDDGNQVQYGLKLDAHCQMAGKEPLFGYWRELDKGPGAPLKSFGFLDGFGYGIEKQSVKSDKTTLIMSIKPAATRVIEIVSRREGEKCAATAFTTIASKKAELKMIFVQLSGPMSVSSIQIKGTELDGGKAVSERIVQ